MNGRYEAIRVRQGPCDASLYFVWYVYTELVKQGTS